MTLPFHLPVSADQILRTGILNQWYMVCKSADLGSTPIRLKRLGRDIALWRDEKGEAHAVEDFCPHRGAPLSRGIVIDGKLACKYHGLTVDGTGTIIDVPPVHNCPLVGKKLIAGYPVREAADAIWLYFSDGINDTVPDLQLPDELTSPEWSGFIYAKEWDCNYQLPLDNRLDPMHAIYLHSDTFTLAYGVKKSVIHLEETEHGFVIERDNQRGVNIDRTEMVHKPGSNFFIFTQIPYPKSAGGNFFAIISHLTPIDENRTYFWVMRYQKSQGWRRDLWRFLYRNRLEKRHDYVIEQDRQMIEAIPPHAAGREAMIQCDIGVSRIRRTLRKMAEAQAERINSYYSPRAAE